MPRDTPLTTWVAGALLSALLATAGCAGEEAPQSASQTRPQTASAPADLTPFQLEHGIGPVTAALELPASVDDALATRGKAVFDEKCSACHKMGERYVGPAVGDVLTRRSPAFVMNMVLNPIEMTSRHPDVKTLVAQYMSIMPNQNVSAEDARALVEFLRTIPASPGGKS